jgi:hypothetical protein
MANKVTLLQSEARRIVQGEELSDDVRAKLDTMLDRGHTRERIEEYLSERIQDTACDRVISVPVPSPVEITLSREPLEHVSRDRKSVVRSEYDG